MAKKVIKPIAQKYFDLADEARAIDTTKILVPFVINDFTKCVDAKKFIESHCTVMLYIQTSDSSRETQYEHLKEFIKVVKTLPKLANVSPATAEVKQPIPKAKEVEKPKAATKSNTKTNLFE